MKKPKLREFEVRHGMLKSGERSWVMLRGKKIVLIQFRDGETKRQFVVRCAAWCRYSAFPETPISLRVYGTDGWVLEERTYPRSADPKRSRG